MNPFEQMTKALERKQRPQTNWQPGLEPKSKSRTGSIRDLLKSTGRPMSAAEIALDLDLPSHTQKPHQPLFGNTSGKKAGTHWLVFMKPPP